MKTATVDKNAHYFEFLEWLRETGQTNMFGAAPYLAKEFGLSKSQARGILSEWMQSYRETE